MKKPSLFNVVAGVLATALALIAARADGADVRIAYLQNDIHHLACWVALEKGFYDRQGVSVEVAGVFRAGPEIMTAFAAGALDMAYVGEAPATTAVANRTARVAAVAQVNTEGSAVVVSSRNTRIETVADLRGKTVAVPGYSTVQDFLLRRALKQAGIDIEAVNIIIVKPPEMIGALRTDQVDAFVAWEPYPSKAATSAVGRTLASSGDIWAGHPCCVLVADTGFLDGRRPQVLAVLKAHVEATRFISENPAEARRIGVKYTGMDEATVRRAMQSVRYTTPLSIEGEMDYVRFLSELKYIQIETPEAFVATFLRPDLLEEIAP